MAEVFRAESEGLQGFRKQVAIKRVLPHLSSKKKFISMFLDEARLSAQLSHSNCVQVFDIGVGDNAYFIVMEFVDGANLKAIIESLEEERPRLPRRGGGLHRPRALQGPRLRPRADRRQRRASPHRPPRHVAAERAHHEVRRGENRGLRPRQGQLPARTERAGDHQGQVLLPVARGRDGRRRSTRARTSSPSASSSGSFWLGSASFSAIPTSRPSRRSRRRPFRASPKSTSGCRRTSNASSRARSPANRSHRYPTARDLGMDLSKFLFKYGVAGHHVRHRDPGPRCDA